MRKWNTKAFIVLSAESKQLSAEHGTKPGNDTDSFYESDLMTDQ